jgi:SLBB domain
MRHGAFCLLVLVALAFAGCRSPNPAWGTSDSAEETIPFSLGVDPPARPHIGHIVRTNSLDPNQTIRVLVSGQVKQPGWVTVPKGTTVLGAIKRAGGFASVGASYYVRITRGTAKYAYKLATEPLRHTAPDHYRIWYGPYTWSNSKGRKLMDKRARSDVVLEPEDQVHVPRVL